MISISLLFLSCFSLTGNAARSMHVGVIINTDTREGREQKIATDIAADRLQSTPFFLDVSEFKRSNLLQLALNAEKITERGVESIIIGTGTWQELATVADITSAARLPLLSLTKGTPPTTASNPLFISMSYSETTQVHCISDLIKSFNWRRLIVIYEDDRYGGMSGPIDLLSDVLQDNGAYIDYKAAFPPIDTISNPRTFVHQKLKRVRQYLSQVYIIIKISPTLAIHLTKEVKELGMMTEGHVWIINDDIATLLDTNFSSSFNSFYMQGIVGIKAYFPEASYAYQEFSLEFQKRFKQEYNDKGDQHHQPGISALRAYDAMFVLTNGFEKSQRENKTFMEGILSSKFQGLSGTIGFRKDGTISKGRGFSTFRIINVVGRSYRDLGFWVEEAGFYKEENKIGLHGQEVENLGPVYFPGGPEKAPGGWGPLRIGIPAHSAFDQFVKVEYHEGGKVKGVTGFCIDVFKETVKRLKYDLRYHEFIPFDGTYDELISQVPSKVFDAVVGDIAILADRLENVTFTEPFLGSGLSMLVRVKPYHQVWTLTKPFTKAVWIFIIILFIYTGGILWCLERKRNPEFDGPWWTQIGATLWLIFSTIFYAHGRVYSYYSKAVIIVWLFMVMILTSIYTATLSSILTMQKFEPAVQHDRIGCDGNSFVVNYLQAVLNYKEQALVRMETADDYARAFESGKINAAYLETPYLRVFLSQHDGYTIHGKTHSLGGLGFVFQKGSPIAADISEAILKLIEDGTLEQLERKWFSFSLSNCLHPDNNRSKDSLSLDNLTEVFLFSSTATTCVFLLFVARLVRRNHSYTKTVSVHLRERIRKMWRFKKIRNNSELPETINNGAEERNPTQVSIEETEDCKLWPLDSFSMENDVRHDEHTAQIVKYI